MADADELADGHVVSPRHVYRHMLLNVGVGTDTDRPEVSPKHGEVPNAAAVLDVDANEDIIFGDELTMEDIVWTGPMPTIAEQARCAAWG